MRNTFLLMSLLISLISVNVFAQQTSTSRKTVITITEQPKNAVERAVDEAKERGETVMGTCLVDCGGDASSQGGESGRVVELPKPAYPPIARAAHASGTVTVQVLIDENGNVVSAHAVSGHPLLQAVAVGAARQARFSPTKLSGQPVKVTGVIQYNFVAQ